MTEQKMCDVCGVRPAVMTVRRIVPGKGTRTENLCEVHAAEVRGARSPFGGTLGGPLGGGSGSLFDDFFGRFMGEEPGGFGGERRAERAAPRRSTEQVDITRLFSASTSELLQRSAQKAAELGSLDLTAEHLLLGTLEDDVARRVITSVDGDPDALKAHLEERLEGGEPTNVSPSLAPDAKRALLSAYEESQALGASYIGSYNFV